MYWGRAEEPFQFYVKKLKISLINDLRKRVVFLRLSFDLYGLNTLLPRQTLSLLFFGLSFVFYSHFHSKSDQIHDIKCLKKSEQLRDWRAAYFSFVSGRRLASRIARLQRLPAKTKRQKNLPIFVSANHRDPPRTENWVPLPSRARAWSFSCLEGFARRTKKKERLLVVYSTYTVREKRAFILKSADSETICRDNKGKT